MSVLVIGPEKCGNHLGVKAVRLFKSPPKVVQDHTTITDGYDYVILMLRNPRNVLFSLLRWEQRERNTPNAVEIIPQFIRNYEQYLELIGQPNVMVVRFEELLSMPSVVDDLGDFLGLEPGDEHFKSLWGDTRTFTNDLTDWRKFWTNGIDVTWRDYGGYDLEQQINCDVNRRYVRKIIG